MLYSVIGAGAFTVSAAEEGDDETASSTVSYDIADVQDLLNAESYDDYAERNADVPRGTSTITINAVDYNAELTDADVEVVNNYNGSTGRALLTPEHRFSGVGRRDSEDRKIRDRHRVFIPDRRKIDRD